ncbi:MAG: FtsX-like permease family protein [Mycobacteriales bacterium]
MLRATFRSLLARKLRLLLSATAVVLGVSFVSGALILTDTLGAVFDDLFASVNSKTAVEVRGKPPFEGSRPDGQDSRLPVPASLLTSVRQVDGVSSAIGDVSGYAVILGPDGKPVTQGRAPALGLNYDTNPETSAFTLRSGAAPTSAGQVAIDAGTAKKQDFAVGDRITVLTRQGRSDYAISGVFGFGANDNLAGASIVAFDQATAEQVVGTPGEYETLRLAAQDGVSEVELRDRVRKVLPAGSEAVTGEEAAAESASSVKKGLGFFNTFLLVFAGVALFVGAFLIFNTFTILVAQRQRELALLRALGASRGQVVRSVLAEALVVGLIASVLGLGAGIGLAAGLQALIRAVGGSLPHGAMVISTSTVIACFVVGLLVTAVAALLPARRASAVPPVAAMRDAVTAEPTLRRGTLIGLVLLALGVVAIAVGLQGSLKVLGLGALLAFLAVAALSPLLSRPAARFIGAPLARKVPGRLGRLNAMRNPRRTATTAAALMVGLALVITVSILGASAKASIDKIIKGAVGADLVVQQTEGFSGFPTVVGEAVSALPQVRTVDVLRFDAAKVGAETTFITAVPPRAVGSTLTLTRKNGELALSPDVILASEGEAKARSLRVGQPVEVTYSKGAKQTVTLGGTYEDNQLIGPYLFDQSAAKNFTMQLDGVLLVQSAKGVSPAALKIAVERTITPYPMVEAQTSDDFAAGVADQINVVITIISVLLLLSIVIAVLGILNTLALAVIERTRELGLLRAIGLARGQTRRMIRVEAVIVSVFGALLGIAVGSAFGVTLQRALADEGITELRFPVVRLVTFVVVAAIAGVVAGILPARRAARLDVLAAVAST